MPGKEFQELFVQFAKFGNTAATGQTITLSQSDKWMKQAGIFNDKKITTTDTGIAFNKFKTKNMDYETYVKYIQALAKEKNMDPEAIFGVLVKGGAPGLNTSAKVEETEALKRLTDSSKYTGTHKERFDDQGKGKGKAGRSDTPSTSPGYVQGYKAEGTYDKK